MKIEKNSVASTASLLHRMQESIMDNLDAQINEAFKMGQRDMRRRLVAKGKRQAGHVSYDQIRQMPLRNLGYYQRTNSTMGD